MIYISNFEQINFRNNTKNLSDGTILLLLLFIKAVQFTTHRHSAMAEVFYFTFRTFSSILVRSFVPWAKIPDIYFYNSYTCPYIRGTIRYIVMCGPASKTFPYENSQYLNCMLIFRKRTGPTIAADSPRLIASNRIRWCVCVCVAVLLHARCGRANAMKT